MIEKPVRMALLFDYYGELLTQRQQDIFRLYHHDDLSLGEIASQFDVSRQAVYDNLKRAEKSLEELEEKLGLVARQLHHDLMLAKIERTIGSIGNLLDRLRTRVENTDGKAAGEFDLLQRELDRLQTQLAEDMADE